MRILSSDQIEKAALPHHWIDAMEVALNTVQDEDYFTPDRMHVDINDNTLLLMPSIGPDLYSTKLVSVFPSNIQNKLPAINGTLVLNDGSNGETVAVMNGAKITAMRTAAVACVGLRHLSDPTAQFLGIIGAGIQGRHIAWLASHERDIQRVYVYDPAHSNINEFMKFMADHCPDVEVAPCEDAQQVIINSEVIATATTSPIPVIPNLEDLLLGKTFIGVGSYKPNMQELPEALFRLIDTIWIDAEHGKTESGDIIEAVKNKWLRDNRIKHISDLINDPSELGFKETRLFKTVGLGIFDLFAAKLVYESACQNKIGTLVDF